MRWTQTRKTAAIAFTTGIVLLLASACGSSPSASSSQSTAPVGDLTADQGYLRTTNPDTTNGPPYGAEIDFLQWVRTGSTLTGTLITTVVSTGLGTPCATTPPTPYTQTYNDVTGVISGNTVRLSVPGSTTDANAGIYYGTLHGNSASFFDPSGTEETWTLSNHQGVQSAIAKESSLVCPT
jgi:hypothetical protein